MSWQVFLACARAAGVRQLDTVRACRVRNTLRVGEAWVSPALLAEIESREDITVCERGLTSFDDNGELMPFESTVQA